MIAHRTAPPPDPGTENHPTPAPMPVMPGLGNSVFLTKESSEKRGEPWIPRWDHHSVFCIYFSLSQSPLNSWDICTQSAETVCRVIRAKINNNNNSNDSHVYVALLFTKDSLNINSTGAILGKEVGKISLRIFPILCVSRINGLKQIRNRLNEVPLVKQKSNYTIGNCNNPSQASASESQCWLRLLPASSNGCTNTERMLVLLWNSKVRAVTHGRGDQRGDLAFPSGDS